MFRQKNLQNWAQSTTVARNKNCGRVILCISVLVMDCYWCGFGGMQLKIQTNLKLILFLIVFFFRKNWFEIEGFGYSASNNSFLLLFAIAYKTCWIRVIFHQYP
jgi:hypothetical protein